jgi:hypothetical protein
LSLLIDVDDLQSRFELAKVCGGIHDTVPVAQLEPQAQVDFHDGDCLSQALNIQLLIHAIAS